MKQLAVTLFAILFLSAVAPFAVQAAEKPVGRFSLGYYESSGNTDESKINMDLRLSQKISDRQKMEYRATYRKNKADEVVTADKHSFSILNEFVRTERESYYLTGGYLNDEFAGYDRQYTVGGGVMRYCIKSTEQNLRVSAGFDWIKEEYTDNTDDTNAWLRLGLDADKKLNDRIKSFVDFKLLAQPDELEDSYRAETGVGLSFDLAENFDAEIKYELNYKKQPAAGAKKNDSSVMVSLVYKI
ncbi:MAG: DUF481 domain-containing protein [Candidatus Riflebacteria bacterium]|nr:DUF481 domain-containing protein [Candidatus Riflebacteria bacterium]